MTAWEDYQEEAAHFFRQLGMQAETNKEVDGARGKHRVDVLVTLARAGIAQTWIVECKDWQRKVDKLHVAALAEIVSDTGADRGFLLTEIGFQPGAFRVARNRNITLTGLEDLRASAAEELAETGLIEARRRIDRLRADLMRIDDLDRGSTPGSGVWVPSNENIAIAGRLAIAEIALAHVHLDAWPLLYAADRARDRGIHASNVTELADGLRLLLDELEAETEELERLIGQRAITE